MLIHGFQSLMNQLTDLYLLPMYCEVMFIIFCVIHMIASFVLWPFEGRFTLFFFSFLFFFFFEIPWVHQTFQILKYLKAGILFVCLFGLVTSAILELVDVICFYRGQFDFSLMWKQYNLTIWEMQSLCISCLDSLETWPLFSVFTLKSGVWLEWNSIAWINGTLTRLSTGNNLASFLMERGATLWHCSHTSHDLVVGWI